MTSTYMTSSPIAATCCRTGDCVTARRRIRKTPGPLLNSRNGTRHGTADQLALNAPLMDFEDILWLSAVRAVQENPGRNVRIPAPVLDRLVATGFAERSSASPRLTKKGALALETFLDD